MTRSRPFRPFPTAAAAALVLAVPGLALADPSLPAPASMPVPDTDFVLDIGLAARRELTFGFAVAAAVSAATAAALETRFIRACFAWDWIGRKL